MKKSTIILVGLILLIVIGGAIYLWGMPKTTSNQTAAPEQTTSSDSVKIASGAAGEYLVDSRGISLYYFTKDTAGKSNCTGGCLAVWPVFYAENMAVSSPLNKADFTTITGSEGSEQLAYKGQPLYYYVKDVNPGDILGNGVNGFWFLVKP